MNCFKVYSVWEISQHTKKKRTEKNRTKTKQNKCTPFSFDNHFPEEVIINAHKISI